MNKLTISLLLSLAAFAGPFLPAAQAYPGAPASWFDWQTRTENTISPRQLASVTDPDGRLRLVFVNALESQSPQQVKLYQVQTVSYTRFAIGTPVDRLEKQILDTGGFSGNSMSLAQLNAPRRMSVAISVKAGGFVPSAYWIGWDEERAYYSEGNLMPWFPRGRYKGIVGLGNGHSQGFAGSNLDRLQAYAAGVLQNTPTTGMGTYLRIYIESSSPGVVSDNLWDDINYKTDRVCNGVSVALNKEATISASKRGFDTYSLVASAIPTGPNAHRELRLWRTGVEFSTANPSDAASPGHESVVISNISNNIGFPGTDKEFRYPKVLVDSLRRPQWVAWEDAWLGRVYIAKRAFSGFPKALNLLGDSYEVPASLGTFLADGAEIDIALDRLDRLHAVWRQPGTPDFCWYARENEDGTFSRIPIGECSGAPTVTVGPGEYPYICYPGPASSGSPLTIRYPRGLMDSYHGDYEDRDSDGRPALLELAMGHSDTVANRTFPVIEMSFVNDHPRLSYFLNADAVRDGGTVRYTFPDGNDTISIHPTYSINMLSWLGVGFSQVSLTNIGGRGRVLTLEDAGELSVYPRQAYRLNVTRTPGAP